jgi:hypothetical protein
MDEQVFEMIDDIPEDTPVWAIKVMTDINALKIKFNDTEAKLGNIETKLDNSLKQTDESFVKFEKSIVNTKLKQVNEQLIDKMNNLEYHTKCNNLIFEGIPEASGESTRNCFEKVICVCANIDWSN